MPTHHNDKQSNDKPQKPISNRRRNSHIINLSVNTGVDQVNNVDTRTAEDKHEGDSITVNVTNPKNDDAQAIAANDIAAEANRIARRSFRVNTGLFVITIIVVVFSGMQSYYANKSVALADSVFQSTKNYNDKIYTQSRIDAVASDSREDRRDTNATKLFKVQDSALNSQIASLKETQKQFKAQNEPYLQLKSVFIDTPIAIGKPYWIKFTIENLGNYPVQVLEMVRYSAIRSTSPDMAIIKMDKTGNTFFGSYIIKGDAPTFRDYDKAKIVSQNTIDKIRGDGFYWLGGIITYKNLISKKKKRYTFMVRVKFDGSNFFTHNENSPIK